MPRIPRDETVVATFAVEIEDDPVRANQRRSKVALLASDALVLALDHIQIYALILSLSLAWPWPYDWIRVNSVVFFFNLDLWEFTKVHTIYQSQTQAYADPNDIPFSYTAYAIFWLFLTLTLTLLFLVIYVGIQRIPSYGPLDVILYRAKLIRVFVIIAQVLTIPFGVTVVRLLDCQSYFDATTGKLQFRSIVLRDTQCWSILHLGITVPLLLVGVIYVVFLSFWFIFNIQRELISRPCSPCSHWRTHEHNIRLKEAEYVQEIDLTWATNHYSLFSSFRRPWVLYRALTLFVKVLILCIYGGLFYQQVIQTIVLFTMIGVILLTVLVVPVYRVKIFNFFLVFSIFIHLCNVTLGMLLSLGVQNALLYGQNLINSLFVVNLAWGISAGMWFTYIYLRSQKIIGKRLGPLWPVLPELDSSNLFRSDHTEKFFKALLCGRRVLERCYSSAEFFAPVHELSRQIQIINAYCREAEVLEDPAHFSLWALLAEMVDAHSSIAPHSIYGTSIKGSVPQKVYHLMKLLPALKKRLEQREYDFILWTPTKQRILLKLLAVSTFLKRKNERIRIPVGADYYPNLKQSQASMLSFMNDDCESSNDRFLVDIEMWTEMRKKSLLPVEDNQFPSICERQTSNETCEVKLWEDDERFMAGHREKRSCSIQSSSSVDRLLYEVEDWQESQFKHLKTTEADLSYSQMSTLSVRGVNTTEHGGSRNSDTAGFSSPMTCRKNTKSASSRLSVRFNLLDTITEQEDYNQQSRPSSTVSSMATGSWNSTDRLIDGVEENFPQDQ